MKNGFIVAGTNSGCGKTTLTIGLMRLLRRKGYKVAPFKTGPDFIDPAFHTMATGTDSHNLDSYLLPAETVRTLFHKYSSEDSVAVVEGVMGMFDGLGKEAFGSTAELARTLNLPVVLVVNCNGLYQSVAALINGFAGMDQHVRIAGVLLNNVYSAEQFDFLKDYILEKCGLPCYGYLPPKKDIALESRHLGLIQAGELEHMQQKIDRIADLLEARVDCNQLLHDTCLTTDSTATLPEVIEKPLMGLVLGVAHDKAFSFYYKANLDLLREQGAQLVFFSPLTDSHIPEGINALYLGGGYPEVFARELSSNRSMCDSIRQAAESNMPVYAECGGLIYLTEGVRTLEGSYFPFCGVFNCSAEMTAGLQNFGYCIIHYDDVSTRAHEFHHSRLALINWEPNYTTSFNIVKPEKSKKWKGGLRYRNVLAGYPHIHFYSSETFYKKIIQLWTRQITQ